MTALTGMRVCRLTFLVKQLKKLSAFQKLKGWDEDLMEWRGHKDYPIDDLLYDAWVKVITKFPDTNSIPKGDFQAAYRWCVDRSALPHRIQRIKSAEPVQSLQETCN